jgi:hypothetical protein
MFVIASVCVLHIHYIFLIYQSIAKVVQHVQQWNPGQPQDVISLLQAMGAQEQDQGLLEFWGASAACSEH